MLERDCTLFVDVWGTYFRQILSRGWLKHLALSCCYAFKETNVVVNNVEKGHGDELNEILTARWRDQEVKKALRVDDEIIEPFEWGIQASEFTVCPYSSWGDLVAIRACKTPYMVFMAGDVCPWGSSSWVAEGIEVLEKREDILTVAPCWNGFYDYIAQSAIEDTDEYYTNRIFSDQIYLIRVADFRKDIYHETNKTADGIYPKKYGNSFEKRVGAWMLNNKKSRMILKSACYLTRP